MLRSAGSSSWTSIYLGVLIIFGGVLLAGSTEGLLGALSERILTTHYVV